MPIVFSFLGVFLKIAIALALVLLLAWLFTYVRDRRFKAQRGSSTLEDYLKFFASDRIPDDILIAVYSNLQSGATVKEFPVLPTDSLYRVYGLVDEDLYETVLGLINKCGCRTPDRPLDVGSLQTVADLVRFLNALRSRMDRETQ